MLHINKLLILSRVIPPCEWSTLWVYFFTRICYHNTCSNGWFKLCRENKLYQLFIWGLLVKSVIYFLNSLQKKKIRILEFIPYSRAATFFLFYKKFLIFTLILVCLSVCQLSSCLVQSNTQSNSVCACVCVCVLNLLFFMTWPLTFFLCVYVCVFDYVPPCLCLFVYRYLAVFV